jgi:high-affinity iron transporter
VLEVIDENLPQRQQEAFEAIIGVIAVAVVTSMVFYMRRHARSMGGELRGQASSALARGSATALVAMAFFAVLREGLETAVFLLATFQSSLGVDPVAAGAAAVVGILIAAALGWGIYRGGVRIDLARFFRVTGVLLVVIAAGLLSSAVHHAGEAGWIQSSQLLDLSAVIEPASDSITSGLITGLLGIYPFPTTAEVVAWLAYAIPMLLVVLWPAGRPVRRPASAAAASSEAPVVPAP